LGWAHGADQGCLPSPDTVRPCRERACLAGLGIGGAPIRAHLNAAHLERADLRIAHLEGAVLFGAHLEQADFSGATGLSEKQLLEAIGDAETKLPEGLARPADWREIGA
jgi:uncharacterized protein YjbI with pentapeptide repeats